MFPIVVDGCQEQRLVLFTTRQDGQGKLDFDAGTSKRKLEGTLASPALLVPVACGYKRTDSDPFMTLDIVILSSPQCPCSGVLSKRTRATVVMPSGVNYVCQNVHSITIFYLSTPDTIQTVQDRPHNLGSLEKPHE